MWEEGLKILLAKFLTAPVLIGVCLGALLGIAAMLYAITYNVFPEKFDPSWLVAFCTIIGGLIPFCITNYSSRMNDDEIANTVNTLIDVIDKFPQDASGVSRRKLTSVKYELETSLNLYRTKTIAYSTFEPLLKNAQRNINRLVLPIIKDNRENERLKTSK